MCISFVVSNICQELCFFCWGDFEVEKVVESTYLLSLSIIYVKSCVSFVQVTLSWRKCWNPHTSSVDGMVSRSEHSVLHIIKWWQGQQVTLLQSSEHSTVCMLLQAMARSVQDPGVANRTFYLSHTSSSDGEVCRWPLCCHRNILPSHTSSSDGEVCGRPWYSLRFTYFIKARSVRDLCTVIGKFCPSHTSSKQGLYVTLVQSLEISALHILHQGKVCMWPWCSHWKILRFTYFIKWWQSLWATSVQSALHILHQDKVCMWPQCSHQKVVPFTYIFSWWQGELVTGAIWSGMRCVLWNIQRWMLQYFVFVILLSAPFSVRLIKPEGDIFLKVCLWCFSFVSLMLHDHSYGMLQVHPSFSEYETLLFASTLSSALCDCLWLKLGMYACPKTDWYFRRRDWLMLQAQRLIDDTSISEKPFSQSVELTDHTDPENVILNCC